MIEIRRYTEAQQSVWNQFVASSKQGTFLFDRRYMDYHADRFIDHSLLVYRQGRLFALMPGNGQGDVYYSHQGLTYGGLLTDAKATAETVCEVFEALGDYLRKSGFRRVVYKPVPHIYHRLPAEEDLYALFLRCHARLIERDASSAISFSDLLPFAESRRSGLRKAKNNELEVCESDDIETFWEILTDRLSARYNASPVHTAAEMKLLKSRFPEQIRLMMVYGCASEPLGGTILYLTSQVVHTQYIAATDKGRSMGALDLLFHHLLTESVLPQRYFDFGTSAIGDSCEVNPALIFQKQGFGGRTICYDIYEWEL
jgi:hypothetical protein